MPVRRNRCWISLVIGLLTLGATCLPALAQRQHLISPGGDWQQLASRIRPGDEIILMPGRHRPAAFESLVGTPDQPIVIRSVDPARPAEIVAEREAIRITRASHLVIRDLIITGGTISGITIGSSDYNPQQPDVNIQIRNVRITRIGPRGQRHAIALMNINHITIEQCSIEGWGGSAVELVACEDAVIEDCRFVGLEEHSQFNGVRVRAGSMRVSIDGCHFERAGERAICVGGASDLNEFRRPPAKDAKPGTHFEAVNVQVNRCLIISSPCAVAFVNSDNGVVRRSTIVRPRDCAVAVLSEQTDPRFNPGQSNVFGQNLITWQKGENRRMVVLDEAAAPNGLYVEANLWWSPELAQQREKLDSIPGRIMAPQVTDLDPELNEDYRPMNAAVGEFGKEEQ